MELGAKVPLTRIGPVVFKVAGNQYGVSAINISLAENGIPGITLAIDPTPNRPAFDMQAADMATILSRAAVLQSKINTAEATATLEVKASTAGDTKPQSLIKLEKWILTAVSASMSATGALTVEVVIQHPIYLGSVSQFIMINTRYDSTEAIEADADQADLLKFLTYAMKEYVTKLSPADQVNAKASSDALAAVLASGGPIDSDALLEAKDQWAAERALAAIGAISEAATWGGDEKTPYPMEPDFMGVYMVNTCGTVASYLTQNNPLEALLTLMAEFQVCMYGAISDAPVVFKPRAPWRLQDVLTIAPSSINYVTLPPDVLNPVSGLVLFGANPKSDIDVSENNSVRGKTETSPSDSNIMCVAGYYDKAPYIAGPMLVTNLPGTLAGYASYCTGKFSDDREDSNNNTSESTGNAESDGTKERLAFEASIEDMASAYCKDMFWNTYRLDAAISLSLRLMIYDTGGKLVGPGRTVDIVNSDGTSIWKGYITEVAHSIDLTNGRCSSAVVAKHTRPGAGIPNIIGPDEAIDPAIFTVAAATKPKAETATGKKTTTSGGGTSGRSIDDDLPDLPQGPGGSGGNEGGTTKATPTYVTETSAGYSNHRKGT